MSAHSAALFDRVFAVVMAFFLPGLILRFGLATASAPVQAWLTGAQGNPTLAGLVFVMMAALALTLSITCVRWLLFEALPCRPAAWIGSAQKGQGFMAWAWTRRLVRSRPVAVAAATSRTVRRCR